MKTVSLNKYKQTHTHTEKLGVFSWRYSEFDGEPICEVHRFYNKFYWHRKLQFYGSTGELYNIKIVDYFMLKYFQTNKT